MVLLSTNASFASFSKNKPRSPGFRHDKEGSKILVKWQTFRAAITLQKNALEKENTIIYKHRMALLRLKK